MLLDPVQIRVLGSLIEKEIVTPELYPLSLNALVNACNQRSSRDPVLTLTEDEVRQALHALEDQELTNTLHDARVPKFEHRIRTVLNLRRDETALLCLLMLRGPQTPGELRSRSERLYAFDDIASIQSSLDRLIARETPSEGNTATTGPLVLLLARQPGSREARYAHLLSGPPEISTLPRLESLDPQRVPQTDRITQLESEVTRLTDALSGLEKRIAALESGQ